MVKFYVNKINAGAINASTGKAWALEDVPKLWQTKVRDEIQKIHKGE